MFICPSDLLSFVFYECCNTFFFTGILRNFDFGQEQVGPDGTQQNNNDLTTLTVSFKICFGSL